MPRARRQFPPNTVLHVVNRGNDRRTLFREAREYDAFLSLVERTLRKLPLRILAYAVMPNHWHFVIWPERTGDVSQFMHRLTFLHASQFRIHSGTAGNGHVYQGRYRAFEVTHDVRYLRTLRYVEANPVRAELVKRAEQWRWSSLAERLSEPRLIVDGPVALPPADCWQGLVNDPVRL
jgi:putative transposase